jgi:pimeloyl-ACP methyl ester carboxylesterase
VVRSATLARATDLGGAHLPNLIYFNEVDKGGHFAAWEQPDLFATEVRAAFRSLR